MRPFFSYYGAKYHAAAHLGRPRRSLVIEPFAGSACYSVRWNCPRVRLYDLSPEICDIWDWLIHCPAREIEAIPDFLPDQDAFDRLPPRARSLLGFWIAKGRARGSKTLSPWYREFAQAPDARVWGPAAKARIVAQKPLIAGWSIACASFEAIPLEDAHWHIDPPYSGAPGRKYAFHQIDFPALADWCRSLPGAVDVCENEGAAWLPFEPLCEVVSSRGRRDGSRSREVVWRKIG